MVKIKFKDAINGREAEITMTYNGRVYDLPHTTAFEMNETINEEKGYTLNRRPQYHAYVILQMYML